MCHPEVMKVVPFPDHVLPRFGLQSVHATILQAHGHLGRYAKQSLDAYWKLKHTLRICTFLEKQNKRNHLESYKFIKWHLWHSSCSMNALQN